MTARYRLRCVGGGEIVPDPAAQSCPNGHDSLLRTEYRTRRLRLAPCTGIFRYLCWLPVSRPLLPSGGAVTYRSTGLARELGLPRLFISFSGYWPEQGAALATGSFKELEALATMNMNGNDVANDVTAAHNSPHCYHVSVCRRAYSQYNTQSQLLGA